MRILLIIILLIFTNSAFSETTEVEVREARTLVIATEKVSISSEIAARVEKINFLMGDALISFDCKLYIAQLDVIKADHKSAKIQLKNDKELLDLRSIG